MRAAPFPTIWVLVVLHQSFCIPELWAFAPVSTRARVRGISRLAMALDNNGIDPTSDLTSALSRMDQVWKIQQRNKPRSRWTKLLLDREPDDSSVNEADDTSTQQQEGESENFVYLLEPPSLSSPSSVIVFVGGAGLGSFPQVAYNEFLMRVSDRLNAAILTAPYGVGLDHFALSKQVGEKCRRALLQCEQDPERLYSSHLPVYCLTHSLGGKLATIYAAATGTEYDGMGFISYNNFSFSSTIGMAKEFAQYIQQQQGRGFPGGMPPDALQGIFNVAESFVGNMGIEFSPSPADTERLISLKFDKERVEKTRLFVMDEDNLDDSPSFLRSCASLGASPQLSALPGNHLAPVYFELDLKDLPQEARDLAQESLGGMQGASFGSNENLQELVDEVCGFLLGKDPTRRPAQPLLTSMRGDEESDSSSSV